MPVRHDWYQTDQKVVVSVHIKNAADKNCKVDIKPDRIEVTGDDDISLQLDLLHDINADVSGYKISPIKIEVSLQKLSGDFWPTLIKTGETMLPAAPMATVNDGANGNAAVVNEDKQAVKPKNHKEWDKLANELYVQENLDKAEDELNTLFQKIYSGSNPEVQRAMNKSFSESGGTVLSTDWNEVKTKKVQVKPPDGMEYRKWDS